MEDIIDIIVTESTNLIEITSQASDETIDVNIIDNREDITLNVTPTLVEININSLTGNFGVNWGDIDGTISNQTDLQNALNLKADLVDGKVPSSQLPSYVDDIVEVANYAALPATGEVGKIYITLDTNFIYRWTGSTYVEIKDSSAVWGAITGTLSSQTDLQSALNAKLDVTTAASTYLPLTGGTLSGILRVDSALRIKSGSANGILLETYSANELRIRVTPTSTTFDMSLVFPSVSRTYTYPNATGTIALTSDLTAYVPYTGATANVDLGAFTLLAAKGTFSNSGSGDTVGITHSSGSGIALNISKAGNGEGIYVNKSSGSGNAVTIVGTLNATTLVKNGGTSAQYLMADGSVSTLTNPVTGTGTSGIVAKFNGTSSITDSIIYDNGTRVSIGADVTTSNKFTSVASTTSSYAVVAQASGAANGFWATLSGTGEIFRGQTSGGSYFIINNGGNAFLNGNLNVGDFASTSYKLNVVGTANFTGALSGTSATFSSTITSSRNDTGNISMTLSNAYINQGNLINFVHNSGGSTTNGYIGHGGDSSGNIVIINNGITALSLARATGAATFSSSVTIEGNGSTIRNGNELRFNRPDNAIYTRMYDAGSLAANGFTFDNTNGEGFHFKNGASTIMRMNSAGNVGIGTTAPDSGLNINSGSTRGLRIDTNSGVQGISMSPNSIFGIDEPGLGNGRFSININGRVGIGTGSPSYKLHVSGDIYANQFRINDTGGGFVTLEMENSSRWRINYLGRFSGYGAGTLTTDASGNVSASSDRTLKNVIKPIENVLENIKDFEPVYFKWNDKTDLDKENVYMSTIAQSIQKHYPDAVGKMADGTLTVQDRAVTAILVQAIKELTEKVKTLENK